MAAFIRFPVAAQGNGATAFDIGERTALLVQQRRAAADLGAELAHDVRHTQCGCSSADAEEVLMFFG